MKRLLISFFALTLLTACNNLPSSSVSVEARATRVISALKARDLETLSQLSHPIKGVRFTPYTYVNGGRNIFFYAKDIPRAMDDPTYHRWGDYDGSGEPIYMTFAEYYDEFIYDHDYRNAPEVFWNQRVNRGNSIDNAAEAYPDSQIVEYHFPGFNEQFGGMDWSSLRLVFEQLDDTWYLVGIIHDQWTI
ncbi:hypothetical protein COU78_03085 [Candidatus Peregrinibacteria bacterium CG10_big_fil_rev_8_21_14_0_10_49_24]|nr:MAG: hypothetical protein COV83_04905 [Candidatus Peregrinibacteria bacterium CG11_big_fil_rev_8_21_14_0_20_49_14]PIR51112.1 MAG: hypothetical protein COU78_03085 [Candidatus Peregrinibacteria bacterium CG10_big_fil_rev_8_21_14_0_10_49_24]